MSVKKSLILALVLNIFFWAVTLSIFVVRNNGLSSKIEHTITIEQTLLLSYNEMYAQGLQAGQATRNILLNSKDDKAVENHKKANEDFEKAYQVALSIVPPAVKEKLVTTGKLWEEDKSLRLQVQTMAISGKNKDAFELLKSQETPKWRAIKAIVADLAKDQQAKFKKIVDEDQADLRNNLLIVAIIMVVSLGTLSFLIFMVTRRTAKSFAQFAEALEHISAGDLTTVLQANGNDEFTIMSGQINKMVSHFRDIIDKINGTTNALTTSSSQLSHSVDQISERINDQSERTTQTATASTEMSQTIVDVAKNAAAIAELSSETLRAASDGNIVVTKTVDEVKEIAETVNALGVLMGSLATRSSQIGNIVGVINDIADQTNLLALNAAIEAARAGEQGRGFAVVADEVRKLAEKTTSSTSEIKAMISAMQQETAKAVESMSRGTEKVDSGVQYAGEAGEALKRIVQSIEALQNSVHQIASSTEEMSTVSDQITSDIESIATLAIQNNNSAGEISNEANDLAKLSTDLKHETSIFKIRG